MSIFTPDAVRDTLLAAGFIEIEPFPKTAGFHVADGREQWGCILVEHRIARQHRLGDELRRTQRVHAYRTALQENGFHAHTENGQILVTGTEAEQ